MRGISLSSRNGLIMISSIFNHVCVKFDSTVVGLRLTAASHSHHGTEQHHSKFHSKLRVHSIAHRSDKGGREQLASDPRCVDDISHPCAGLCITPRVLEGCRRQISRDRRRMYGTLGGMRNRRMGGISSSGPARSGKTPGGAIQRRPRCF